MSEPKKRFIAGAVCPSCKAEDRIRTWQQGDTTFRECITCGYTDTLDERGNAMPKELATRVNHDRPYVEGQDPDVQVLHFVPNPSKTRH